MKQLYSTAGDKVNQTAEALKETGGEDGDTLIQYLTLGDKNDTLCSYSAKVGDFHKICLPEKAIFLHNIHYHLREDVDVNAPLVSHGRLCCNIS